MTPENKDLTRELIRAISELYQGQLSFASYVLHKDTDREKSDERWDEFTEHCRNFGEKIEQIRDVLNSDDTDV